MCQERLRLPGSAAPLSGSRTPRSSSCRTRASHRATDAFQPFPGRDAAFTGPGLRPCLAYRTTGMREKRRGGQSSRAFATCRDDVVDLICTAGHGGGFQSSTAYRFQWRPHRLLITSLDDHVTCDAYVACIDHVTCGDHLTSRCPGNSKCS